MAIGARSQSAKTYLERHLDEFVDSDLDALVAHGLRALRDTLPNEIQLNNKVRTASIFGPCQCYQMGDLLDFGRLFKACGNYKFAQISHIFRQFLMRCQNLSFF